MKEENQNKLSNLKYLLPIRIVLFSLVFLLGAYITKQKISNISNWWSVAASIINIITIIIISLFAKKYGSSFLEVINYEKGKTKLKHIIVIIEIILIGVVGMYIAGYICYGKIPYTPSVMIGPIPIVLAIINVVLLPITTVFAEDGLYLGCGVNQIKNKYLAIIIPSIMYSLQHCFIPLLFNGKFMIYRFLSFLPLTIFVSIYYYKKKNIVPVMIGHAILDIATVITILLTSASPELYQMVLTM